MLQIPHLLLFLPVCVLSGLAFAIAAIAVIIETASQGRPAATTPLPESRFSEAPMPSAQIIYFRPRKTSLRSLQSLDAPAHGRVFNGG